MTVLKVAILTDSKKGFDNCSVLPPKTQEPKNQIIYTFFIFVIYLYEKFKISIYILYR